MQLRHECRDTQLQSSLCFESESELRARFQKRELQLVENCQSLQLQLEMQRERAERAQELEGTLDKVRADYSSLQEEYQRMQSLSLSAVSMSESFHHHQQRGEEDSGEGVQAQKLERQMARLKEEHEDQLAEIQRKSREFRGFSFSPFAFFLCHCPSCFPFFACIFFFVSFPVLALFSLSL